MKHYFSDNTDLKHEYKEINYEFNDSSFKFLSDSGVFSRDKIDFGSELLLKSLKDIKGDFLDLGCGYGVISIVSKKLFDINAYGVDVNPRAVLLSKNNAKLNNVEVEYFVSNGFSNINKSFDNILVNPPIRAGKEVIYKMFVDAYSHLKENGELWVVIRKQQGANSALNKLNEIFDNCKIINKDKGYWILKSKK